MAVPTIRKRYNSAKNWTLNFFKTRPLVSFAIILVLLFGLIALGNFLRQPEVKEEQEEVSVKPVSAYQIGAVPRVAVQAQVQKSGVISIVAQSGGIVRSLPVEEGDTVSAGTTVVGLASNYSGANALSTQRQIASQQYTFNKDNYDLQKELINQQRRIAELNEDNQEELREISRDSLDKTDDIIDSTRSNLDLLNDMIEYYEDNLSTDDISDFSSDESVLLGLKQQRVGLLNSLQAAEQARDITEYTTDEDEASVELQEISKDNALKQLELQEKTLALNLEVSRLSLQLARISESVMYPSAPFAGTIERVHVKVGEAVNPGDTLITFSGSDQSLTAIALVSQSVAEQLSRLEPSIATINNITYEVYPSHISSEATDGRLFSVVYPLVFSSQYGEKGYDAELLSAGHLVDGQYITIELPIGYSDSPSSFAFIPVDAVYQTQDTAYIFVIEDGKAVSKEITLGSIFGRFVEVTSGLSDQDVVILDRTVLAGDPVAVK